jgi:hypothetical protein
MSRLSEAGRRPDGETTFVRGGVRVTIYDQMPAVGRKFLLAGRGGLNLTHSEPLDQFLRRYGHGSRTSGPRSKRFRPTTCAPSAPNSQPTFVGSAAVCSDSHEGVARAPVVPPCRDGRDFVVASLAWLGRGRKARGRYTGQTAVAADASILVGGAAGQSP